MKIETTRFYTMQKLTYLVLFAILFICLSCNRIQKAEIKNGDGYLIETFEFIGDSIKHGLQTKFVGKEIKEKASYKKGVLNGQRNIYFKNGLIEVEENYVDGKHHGPYRVYYPNGNLNIEGEYTDGKMQGIIKKYYESGEIMEEVTMKDNLENGPFKEFHVNGNVQWVGTYLNGDNEYGELKQYDETGKLIKKMMCDSMAVCQTIWTLEGGNLEAKDFQLSQN